MFLHRLPEDSRTPLLSWVAMLPTATSGWLAKVVPDTGFSYEKSPKNITSNPPNGRSVLSARRFQLSRFQVTLPIRMSRTPTSCAEIILTALWVFGRGLAYPLEAAWPLYYSLPGRFNSVGRFKSRGRFNPLGRTLNKDRALPR